MKKYFLVVAVTLLCSGFVKAQSTNQISTFKLDISSLESFWTLSEILLADREPDETEWQQMFKTGGYQKLGNTATVKRRLQIALKPSYKKIRDSVLGTQSYEARVITHLNKIPAKKNEIAVFLQTLSQSNNYEEGRKRAASYLPKGVTNKYEPPQVYFAIFEPDAFAKSNAVIIDAYYAVEKGKESFLDFLGHEFHHHFKFAHFNIKTPDAAADEYYLFRTMQQLQLEGIADLIDKKKYPLVPLSESGQWYAGEFNKHYRASDSLLKAIDSLIAAVADTPSLMKENARLIWSKMPFGCHPTGFYMAITILAGQGKNELISGLKHPFHFILSYNQAAQKSKETKFCFSRKAIEVLKRISALN